MQYRPHAEALYAALKEDPFYRTLEASFPDPAQAGDAMLAYYDASIQDAERWGRLGLPRDGSHGISIWSIPLSPADAATRTAQKRQALLSAMGPECLDVFTAIESSMEQHEAALALDDHWYLSILGVHPDKQGKGLGPALVLPVLAEADAVGAPSYLTTFTPRNIPFYRRLGYIEARNFPEPVTGDAFTVLVRPAGGS